MLAKLVLPKAVKEVRFLLSPSGDASKPLRSFIAQLYPALKSSNPTVPILVREAYSVPPSITVRLEKGLEKQLAVEGLESGAIEARLKSLAGL